MIYDLESIKARGTVVWDDAKSRLVPNALTVDDGDGSVTVMDEPRRFVNGALVVKKLYMKPMFVFLAERVIVVNAQGPWTAQKAHSLMAVL